MSTRANYIFKSGRKTLATFYIYHDGYPEGAAEYFHKALIFDNGKINSPDAFLRANDACEISCIHGDIEYLYEFDIKTQKLKVFKIHFTETGNNKSLYIVDDIYMFINRYSTVFSSSTKLHEYRRKYSWKSDSEIEQIIKNEKTWHYISAQSRWNHEAKTKALGREDGYHLLLSAQVGFRSRWCDYQSQYRPHQEHDGVYSIVRGLPHLRRYRRALYRVHGGGVVRVA